MPVGYYSGRSSVVSSPGALGYGTKKGVADDLQLQPPHGATARVGCTAPEVRRHGGRAMTRPFEFWGCHDIRESLGVRADTERELAERLRTISAESVFHHSVRCLMHHQVGSYAYPDDFARWVARDVGDPELAERLALFSPFDVPSIEAFRDHLVATIEDHLDSAPHAWTTARTPFRFIRGHLVALPIGLHADDLATLRAGLASVDDSAIYFHTVESPGQRGLRRSDIATWVDEDLGLPALATRLAEIDPFVAGLGRTRALLLATLDGYTGAEA